MALATIGSIGFVLLGLIVVRIARSNGEALMGILTCIVFGSFGLFGLFVLLKNPPRLILSETGLTIRGAGIGEIVWSDISSVEHDSFDRHPMITLTIGRKEKYLKRRATSRNPLHEYDGDLEIGYVTIELATLDIENEVLVNALREKVASMN
jgi:hypothetical protein